MRRNTDPTPAGRPWWRPPYVEPIPVDEQPISLDQLCIIVGCLNLRTGANLCDYHERIT